MDDIQQWQKKVHVESSLPAKDSQFAMFIGRWQPLHFGHIQLFNQAFHIGKKVLICIRDVAPDHKNPFTAEQVKENIKEQLALLVNAGTIKVMIIPDIQSIEFGRGVGYDIIEHIPPQEVGDISATKIREEMRKDGKL